VTVPLATLKRHSSLVWLHEGSGVTLKKPPLAPAARTNLTRFDSQYAQPVATQSSGGVEAYLRYWRSDADAVRQLRYALHRCGHSATVSTCSNDEVIRALAAKVAQGALVLTESVMSPSPVPGLPQPVPPPVVAEAPPLALASVPVVTAPPALLPLVEEVQVEGAEVLPEIEQTLEQIDVSMANIELTSASLEPAPTKIPLIGPAMQDASSSVTTTLDGL